MSRYFRNAHWLYQRCGLWAATKYFMRNSGDLVVGWACFAAALLMMVLR
jgi:hypothetical protein